MSETDAESNASAIMQKYSTLANKKIKRARGKVQKLKQNRRPIIQPRILIIDGTNCYLRRFSVHQHGQNKNRQLTSRAGQQTGAIYTMILMINKMIQQLKATHRFICWQGYNSKQNRLKINENYKANRVFKKSQSFIPQLKRVQRYLTYLPINQMKVDYTEADDIIALIAKQYPYHQKIIVSQDQDFIQLVNDRQKTKLFLPLKKLMLDQKKVLQKYQCHPRNFIYMKAILGDSSDNVTGVKGVGPKTINKQLGEKLIKGTVKDVDDLAISAKSEKMQKLLAQKKQLLLDNISIMNLNDNLRMLSSDAIDKYKQQLDSPVGLDNAQLRILMRHDGIYHKTVERVVKQMHIVEYLRKKWKLEKRKDG